MLAIKSYFNLKDFDFLIISGGGQLDDSYGGAWSHPYALMKWVMIAKFRKTPVAFVSVGAGPIKSKLSQWFIKTALSKALYRSYRDESSKNLISEIGFKRNDFVYPDLAHSLDFSIYHGNTEIANHRYLTVGVGPMVYCDPRSWPRRDINRYHKYLSKLASFVHWLLEQKHRVVLFPGVSGADQLAIRDLTTFISQMNVQIPSDQVKEINVDSVHDLLSGISHTDIVVASRFHGVLLSHALYKPVLALSYHDKVTTLMKDIGHSDYCLDIETFDLPSLIDRFKGIQKNRISLGSQIALKEKEYQEKLNQQYENLYKYILN